MTFTTTGKRKFKSMPLALRETIDQLIEETEQEQQEKMKGPSNTPDPVQMLCSKIAL